MNEPETQRLARRSERTPAALEALQQPLLHQAFTGGFDRLSLRRAGLIT